MFDVDPETQRQFDHNAAEHEARSTALAGELDATRRALAEQSEVDEAALAAVAEELAAYAESHTSQGIPRDDDIPADAGYYAEATDDPAPAAPAPRTPSTRRPSRRPPADDEEDLSQHDWFE